MAPKETQEQGRPGFLGKFTHCLASTQPCLPRPAQCKESDGCIGGSCRKNGPKTPLLDVNGTVCACGCMGKTASPLNNRQQWCTVCSIIFAIYILIGGIVQWGCFHFATMNCGAMPENYQFPGGGHGVNTGGPEVNLVPRHSIVVERTPMWYGMAFDVYNATDNSQPVGAPVGAWFRTWGPFFSTYTYQDVLNSQPTIYMRASIQSMTLGYYDDYVMRCDGKGSVLRLSEGQHWLTNRMRNFFRMNQGISLKVWRGGEVIGMAEETFHGAKSITFKNETDQSHSFASAALMGKKYETETGKKLSQWIITNHQDSPVPWYETQAMCVLYAFRIYNDQEARLQKESKKGEQFLVELPTPAAVTQEAVVVGQEQGSPDVQEVVVNNDEALRE